MKVLKKKGFVWLLLVLTVASVLLPSCKQDPSAPEITTEEETTVDPNEGRFGVVVDGKTDFVVVYPDEAPNVVMQAMNRLVNAVKEKTGVRLDTRSDFLRFGAEHDPNAFEILIGSTNYEETKTVANSLAIDQYAIRREGNKIVIAARDDSYILSAVNFFIAELLEPNLVTDAVTGKVSLFLEEYTLPSASEGKVLSINGNYIHEFTIVYATSVAGYQEVAKQLRDLIADSTGYRLSVVADSEKKTDGCEILVGPTDRDETEALYAASAPKLMTYEVAISGNKLQILCGGPFSARECVSYLRFFMFNGETLKFGEGNYFKTDLAEDSSAFTSGTDIRLMTSNILAARWGEDSVGEDGLPSNIPPVEQRAEIFAAVLAKYQPDVVGVQETDHKWVLYLPTFLEILKNDYGMEYTWLFSEMDGKVNLTSMLYRSDKLELLESEREDFSFWKANNYTYHLRVLAWGKFRVKAEPTQEFIVLNTHWSWETPEQIATCVSEEIAKVNELKAEHNVPIFCTGDFNSRQDSEEVLKFMTEAGVNETMLQAKENGTIVKYCGGCGSVGAVRNSETYIDHIFGCGSYSVLKNETVLGNHIIWLSDHAPQYTDIKFGA